MSALVDAMEALLQCHTRLGRPLETYLRPGLSEQGLIAEFNRIGSAPGDLVQLYAWHDGVEQDGHTPGEVELFPGYEWLSLRRALGNYRSFERIPNHLVAPGWHEYWRPGWLPIFDGMGGCYFVVSCVKDEDHGKVLAIRPGATTRVAFRSIQQMILSLLRCFEAGMYFVEDGLLEEDTDASWSLLRELNPDAKYWQEA